MGARNGLYAFVVFNVLLTWCPLRAPSQQQPEHMQRWFDRVDSDKDGQLQQQELRQFVGANLGPTDYNTMNKLDAAVQQITGKLDSSDVGIDISMNELDQYLHKTLEGVKVSDWVSHSLGLPQYAQTFKNNAITVLDFPMLVNDGGRLLETELMVTRVLHRHKIMKAMQRQMLGLGAEPGPIRTLDCTASSRNPGTAGTAADINQTTASGDEHCVVTCAWEPPAAAGEPALHMYVLERFAVLQPGAKWETAAELDDSVTTRFTDVVRQPGVFQYRLSAWNLYGRSKYVLSSEVLVDGRAHGDAPHAGMAAPVSPESQQQTGMARAAGAVGTQLAVHGPQLVQQPVAAGSLNDGTNWQHLPLEPEVLLCQHHGACTTAADHSCGPATWQCSDDMPEAHSCTVAAQAVAAAAPAQRQEAAAAMAAAGPNVVWVVGQGALSDGSAVPATAAAAIAQAQLLASMQAAGRGYGNSSSSHSGPSVKKPSRVVGVVGGELWRWIRAGLNSLLLLVLPLLVRLLPVHMLHRLVAAAGRVFRLLPLQMQQSLLLFSQSSRQGSSGFMPSVEIVPDDTAASASSCRAGRAPQQTASAGKPAAAAAAASGVTLMDVLPSTTGAKLSDSPVHTLHHIASAPALSAVVDAAAFGCPGQLPGDAAALGLPASKSYGALQLGIQSVRGQTDGGVRAHKLHHESASEDYSAGGAAVGGESMALPRLAQSGGSSAAAAHAAAAESLAEDMQQGDTAGSVYSQGSFEQCGLQLAAALEQQVPGNKRCAFPGCQQQFDLRHFKALRQRHYCGRCQQAFCLQHTAYSPHGASGSCGAESRCVCVDCFHEFTPEYRSFLTMRNTLVQRRSASGPPRDRAVGSMSSSDGGRELGRGIAASRLVGSSPARLQKPAPVVATASRGVVAGISGDAVQTGPTAHDGIRPSSSSNTLDDAAKVAGSVMGRMLWARGLAKAQAVVRFKKAGQQHS